MKKTLIVLFPVLFLNWHFVTAQRQITGTVKSAEDNLGIPGATVAVPGTTSGTITDFEGQYILSVPDGATELQFSFVGMKTKIIPIGSSNVINVILETETVGIDEIVVTAFGIEREKKALGYSIQEVSGDIVSAGGSADVSKALQGKIAGITVKQASGMPGSSSLVTIRGSRSFTGDNQPLYVVDGLPIESGSQFGVSYDQPDASNRVLDLNPDDIESISVLKGPTAAALYGLRATNGVVIITTKGGKAKKDAPKVAVTINSSYTLDKISIIPDFQKTYAQGVDGELNLWSRNSWGPEIHEMEAYYPQIVTDTTTYSKVKPKVYDNITPFFKNGNSFKNSADVTFNTGVGTIAIGIGAHNQGGIIPNTGMNKYNGKVKGFFNLSEKLDIMVSANIADVHIDKSATGSNYSNPLLTLYFAPVSYDLWGTPYEYDDDPYSQHHYRKIADNPRWSVKHNKFFEDTKRLFGDVELNYKLTDWLKATYRLGTDYFKTDGKDIYSLGSGYTGGRSYPDLENAKTTPDGGSIRDYYFEQTQVNSNLFFLITKRFSNNLRTDLLVGNEFYDIRTNSEINSGYSIQVAGTENINNTKNIIKSRQETAQRNVGFYANLTVDYKSLLFLNVSGRNDIVSNMPQGNRSFFYPSVALGFAFTELPAFQDVKYLSFGKLRASFAQVGQAGTVFATKNVYVDGGHENGYLTDGIQFPLGDNDAYTADNTLYSDDLKPQNTNTYEVGTELRFFKNRIGIDYTYYKIDATDQIFEAPLPYSTGYAAELRNAGHIETTGHELVVELTPVKTKNFQWQMNFNYSTSENKVIELAEDVEYLSVGYNLSTVGVYAFEGYSYPVIYGTKYLRDGSGNIVVEDDETSDYYGMPVANPQKGVIATVSPDYEISIINTFSYKTLSVSAQVDIRQGGHMYAGLTHLARSYGVDKITENRDKDFIENGIKGHLDDDGNLITEGEANDIAIKRQADYWDVVMWEITESAVFETSFIRLRELSVNYILPAKWFDKMFVKQISVYAMGRNLWLSTDYPNFDPEASTSSGNATGGFEYASLPNTKSYGAGIKILF